MALTDVAIKNAKAREKPYKMGDAGGLFLLVQPSGGKLWRLKYRVDGREKKLGIWYLGGKVVAQLTLVSDVDCREPYPCLKITGQARGERINCLVLLDNQPMHFGGERWYALCPSTGKRCTTLVLPPGKTHFASVSGWGVAYGSQRECEVHRAYRAIHGAEARLRVLSKYVRTPTRQRLVSRITRKHMLIDEELDRMAGRLWSS